jgi:uncharacterized protein (TIGR00730 family)
MPLNSTGIRGKRRILVNMNRPQKPPKAYRNQEFLNSPEARTIRILAEYNEPRARFKKYGVENSIVFFGSARSKDLSKSNQDLHDAYALKLSEYYNQAVELSKKITEWSFRPNSKQQTYYVCSGGGPGMMEAANKGATLAGGKSIGLNISIPMEQYPNPYITEELKFEFHYFFIRKFWFVYLAKALIIFPGGFGTLDELMEVLTLIQTEKLGKKLPIILYGKEFWHDVINFDAMIKWGTISKNDLDLMHLSDDVDDAFNYLIDNIQPNGG